VADTAVVLPAAGRGQRLGQAKQFLEIAGVPLVARAALAAQACPDVAAIVVAAPPGDEGRVRELLEIHGVERLHAVVAGGAERADSVRAALQAIPPEAALVAVHDAARPFATPGLFSRVIAAARATGAAIAALPCTDTVKRSEAGAAVIRDTLDRRELWLAQTPQVFTPRLLRDAYRAAGARASSFTDDASLVEATGHAVALVPGEKENFKVTDEDDLRRARARAASTTAVGFGMDVHAFAEGRRCMLGGVEFPGEVGLLGHSDADAPLHALMDAILGAAGLGDIGQLYPDHDPSYAGADSGVLLEEVVRRARAAGFVVLNADLTIAAARPRIGPRRDEMRTRIAALLGIPEARVNVKATTTEGLGFVGRAEGIAAQAVVLLGSA
jgi:2-C-methyl-D-erythritol 4-phosphate cytidylyltransferase/2-C-methyl-D-erythritol 2,4-cyclodiphosphate synthase